MTEHGVTFLEVDGATGSGSGTIVREAMAYAALTRRPIRVVNARANRPNPGLRHQHLCAVQAICDLTAGTVHGAEIGARTFSFSPGEGSRAGRLCFDVGSAGSVTALARALIPVIAFRGRRCDVELRGGLFQDFAPSVFHLEHVLAPLLARMGLDARLSMVRPGYVPKGGGILRLSVEPLDQPLRPLTMESAGALDRIWGIALASHLRARRVAGRMAAAAREVLAAAGYDAEIDEREDTSALQAGAAFALFADLSGGVRLGADRAGAPHRPAEGIGRRVAAQLLDEIATGCTVDRFAGDQIVLFAALARGETRVRLPTVSEHMTTAAWLARLFLDVDVRFEGSVMTVRGAGLEP